MVILAEEEKKRSGKAWIRWDKVLEALDVLDWPRGPAEEIFIGMMETGDLIEPRMGFFEVVNFDYIVGMSEMPDIIRCPVTEFSGYLLRTELKRHLDEMRTRKAPEKVRMEIRIRDLPVEVAHRILGILREEGITSITTNSTPRGI